MAKLCPVITVDGPSGTGKGTISQQLAQRLCWNLLDSGALYRALALAARQHDVSEDNEAALGVLAAHLDVAFAMAGPDMPMRIVLEGEDVTDAIRTAECGNCASKIAALPKVRQSLLKRQRVFREAPGLVTDGRDMGTVVFPDAVLKIYLSAERSERVRRRYNQLKEKGINVSLAEVEVELDARDQRDQQRAIAPLKPADDAVVVDTTGLSIDQVMTYIMQEVRAHLPTVQWVG